MDRRTIAWVGVAAILLAAPAQAQTIRELEGHRAPVSAVAFRPDGRRMATASFDHTIKVWDLAEAKAVQTFEGHQARVLTLAWSPDGSLLASGGLDGVRVWGAAGDRSEFVFG